MPFQKFIDGQYRRPSGVVGRLVGNSMARQHVPENLWTVSLLDPQPADHILEVGFGPGIAIEALTNVVTEGLVAGVDFSRAMLAAASKRNSGAIKSGRVQLKYADAASLPFGDSSFNKAFSIHSIYFWPRPPAALRELHRVLMPGGMLVMTVLPKEKWPSGSNGSQVGTPECVPYSGDELVEMLQDAGFSSTRIVADPEPKHPSNFSVIATK